MFPAANTQLVRPSTSCHSAVRRCHRRPYTRKVCATTAPKAATVERRTLPFDKSYFTPADPRPIILFDGVCNLCNGGVNFMLTWDTAGKYRFAALQSPVGKALLQKSGRNPEDISSIVLVEESASYFKSEAILRIAAGLNLPLPALAAAGFAFPLPVRDFVYDQVANNRYHLLGRVSECRLSDARFKDRFVLE